MSALLIAAFLLLLALLAIDWLQTLTIVSEPARWRERNPLIRKLVGDFSDGDDDDFSDARSTVTAYFGVCAILAALVTWFLVQFGGMWVWAFLGFCTAAELVCVVNNFLLGIEPFDVMEND